MGFLHAALLIATYVGYIAVPYFLFLICYRLRFHPLQGYSGPFLAKITDAYAGYYALKRSLHLATHEDHQRYGNVLRYGPNRLVFKTPAALSDIYQNPRVTKSDLYLLSLAQGGLPYIFNTLDRAAHLRKRKIIGSALSERSMRLFEPTLMEQTNIFIEEISRSCSAYINLTERCQRLAMDFAAHLGFGFPLDLQTKEENRFLPRGITLANYRINSYMNFPFLSKLGFEHLFKRSTLRTRWRSTVERMITSRVSQDKNAKADFYSFVANNLSVGSEGIQHSELFAESLFFMSAGGDTVSTAMTALFFYLSRNRHCYDKLREEIRTTFGAGEEIRGGPQLSGCRYLHACINETIRISPPIGGTLWRQLAADQQDEKPFVVDGHVIPPGTHVGVNTYSMHHSEEYFPEPFEFKPERWLSTAAPSTGRGGDVAPLLTHKAFAPFSVGARGCAGKPMAYLEIGLVMAKTMWHFDFEMAPGSLGDVGSGEDGAWGGRGRSAEFQLYDIITSRHDGPYLRFTPRVG